ncbi:phosphotransferase enzyme family protein [Podospora didyma]|uniref:Phosphotransferase enzyme family protein n=1 Tax=Podospora didyma TaxID=330526 RepID=A0AAE0NPE3_9PEZI|nr:phosphotransferase enzyme family protein [Podospora didyma]
MAPKMTVIKESSFFRGRPGATLPTPSAVRARNKADAEFARPPPVRWGGDTGSKQPRLLIKYGADVTVGEALTQHMAHQKLLGRVPIPEVFGWAVDGGQTFIYMEEMRGDTFLSRWKTMTDAEKMSVCKQLNPMVQAWRSLKPPSSQPFIGTYDGTMPLNDIWLCDDKKLAGPFQGSKAVKQFHEVCDISIHEDVPAVFTHDDFMMANILISKKNSNNKTQPPKVEAVLDWGQAGWYPAYWEFCKAFHLNHGQVPELSSDDQEEWRQKYLPIIMDPQDIRPYINPFVYFVNSHL